MANSWNYSPEYYPHEKAFIKCLFVCHTMQTAETAKSSNSVTALWRINVFSWKTELSRHTHARNERERDRDRESSIWLTPNMFTIATAKPGRFQELFPALQYGCRSLSTWAMLSCFPRPLVGSGAVRTWTSPHMRFWHSRHHPRYHILVPQITLDK